MLKSTKKHYKKQHAKKQKQNKSPDYLSLEMTQIHVRWPHC